MPIASPAPMTARVVMEESRRPDKRASRSQTARRGGDPARDDAPERVPSLARARGVADDGGGPAETLERAPRLRAGKLVQLGRDHHGRQRHGGGEVEDLRLFGLETAADVDDQHDAPERRAATQVPLHERSPAEALA